MPKAKARPKKPGKKPFPRKGPRHNPKRDEIVLEVVQMMNACQWVAYESSVALRKKHGITASAARDYASEASRHIRLALDQQEAKSAVMAGIELGIRKCLEAVRPQYDQMRGTWHTHPSPNLTALKDLLRLRADVMGLTARQEVAQDQPGVDVSADELAQVLESSGYHLSKKG